MKDTESKITKSMHKAILTNTFIGRVISDGLMKDNLDLWPLKIGKLIIWDSWRLAETVWLGLCAVYLLNIISPKYLFERVKSFQWYV